MVASFWIFDIHIFEKRNCHCPLQEFLFSFCNMLLSFFNYHCDTYVSAHSGSTTISQDLAPNLLGLTPRPSHMKFSRHETTQEGRKVFLGSWSSVRGMKHPYFTVEQRRCWEDAWYLRVEDVRNVEQRPCYKMQDIPELRMRGMLYCPAIVQLYLFINFDYIDGNLNVSLGRC